MTAPVESELAPPIEVAPPEHIAERAPVGRPLVTFADVVVLCLVAAVIGALVSFARQFEAPYSQAVRIDLSPWALPRYTLFSLLRGVIALVISYLFAFVFGWAAATSARAERFLLPVLDILQSIPVLGFLPGLVLGLVALFPDRNAGLELAAILMIFTAQAWNLAFSFYNSLKSVPEPLREAAQVAGWGPWTTFRRLEVPSATPALVWNGMLSMAAGWFFLMVNEAFQLGGRDFRLPGIGAYMSAAIDAGDRRAIVLALVAMVVMIVAVDRLFWRPLVVWAQKFRLDDSSGEAPASSWLLEFFRRSRLRVQARSVRHTAVATARVATFPIRHSLRHADRVLRRFPGPRPGRDGVIRVTATVLGVLVAAGAGLGVLQLARLLLRLDSAAWLLVARSTAYTFLRVLAAVALSTAWALPVGVIIGRSPRISRVLQPIIQIVASFPAPMLFPLVILGLLRLGAGMGIGAVTLMVLSAQWYILFNVISAVAALPPQLADAAEVFRMTGWPRWRRLYLPAAFPALVTGWITAGGGAWNGSIVAEYVQAGGTTHIANGLGSLISLATVHADFPLLAGGIAAMSVIVVGWNRLVWRPLAALAQTQFGVTQ
ncbi:MAG TPA: ABC transporter permease subunit [Gemmatimonadales bacterium]|nr:ABC transporter permease subunit [Gemmatimonadales bacterium]